MEILDEELLHAITDSEECKVAFQEYKWQLKMNIWKNATVLTVFFIFFFYYYNSISEVLKNGGSSIALFAFVVLAYLLFSLKSILYSIIDLNLKKLDIKSDVFMKATVIQNQKGSEYLGFFQGQGRLLIPRYTVISKFAKDAKVYIVRTDFSKTLLDIIPADKIDNQT